MNFLFQGSAPAKAQFFFSSESGIPSELSSKKLFCGESGENFIQSSGNETLFFFGLGKKPEKGFFSYLKAGAEAARQILKTSETSLELIQGTLNEQELFFLWEGFFLEVDYQYSMKKKKTAPELKTLIFPKGFEKTVQKAHTLASSRNWVREAVDTPSNILTPETFAERISALFKESPVTVEVQDFEQIQKEDLQGLIHVGKGSQNLPRLVKLHYRPENPKKTLILIGKGVTFDSGGLSLKPTESMLDMKGDMAGAATVAGVMKIAEALKLPVEIYGLLPLAENMISGNAYKVSDVVSYRNGKSVEITNTDAEGRLILADALILAGGLPGELVIDLATLTGACMVALGTDIYGVFARDEQQGRSFSQFVNEKTSEFAWDLPLFQRYTDNLKSKLADLKNTGKRWGGAISAALFLNEFLPESKAWMHLDIAGPFYDEGLGLFDGRATGIPVESLYLYLEQIGS